ncbi:MAG TPA: Gfo/Idh/MocA family oxidoreductase, partial [Lacipirellulaceae bacterium]|nr:Gfo/Idh/MocA family oxidoreductase [Lacipirellulaceae bacterium]
VQIAAVCDVDPQRRGAVQESSGAPGVGDLRRILDDPSVDAVTIATPDHWHVPAALLALAAGKHVYVEKPCSHNVREGRWLVDAARRSGRVVAHGTQSRSSPGMQEAIALLRDGIIGEVLLARCWNYQLRESIGRRQPSDPPAGVDYDQWVGPALWMPYQENRFHYHWHWWHNFGTGDVGNDGCHELDLALWGLGVERLPSVVAAAGGKFFFEDDQQWPDTAQITLQWERPAGRPLMLIYEQRLWTTNYPHGVDGGVEFFGVGGRMFLSKRGKFEVLGERNRPLDVRLEHPVEARLDENLRDWLDAIRENRTPQASIEIAHRTATAAHLGNIALRTGR